jgi:hypothetical protein
VHSICFNDILLSILVAKCFTASREEPKEALNTGSSFAAPVDYRQRGLNAPSWKSKLDAEAKNDEGA